MVLIPALQYLQLAWDDRFTTHPDVRYSLIGLVLHVALFFRLIAQSRRDRLACRTAAADQQPTPQTLILGTITTFLR